MTALPDPMWLIGQPMPDLAGALEVERRGFDIDGRAPSNLPPWKPYVSPQAFIDTPALCAARRCALNAEMSGHGRRPRRPTRRPGKVT